MTVLRSKPRAAAPAVMGIWQNRRIRDLNRELPPDDDEKELLIRQKVPDRQVNHRVQNSLQLVSGFC